MKQQWCEMRCRVGSLESGGYGGGRLECRNSIAAWIYVLCDE